MLYEVGRKSWKPAIAVPSDMNISESVGIKYTCDTSLESLFWVDSSQKIIISLHQKILEQWTKRLSMTVRTLQITVAGNRPLYFPNYVRINMGLKNDGMIKIKNNIDKIKWLFRDFICIFKSAAVALDRRAEKNEKKKFFFFSKIDEFRVGWLENDQKKNFFFSFSAIFGSAGSRANS